MSASFSLLRKIYELCALSGRESKMFRLLFFSLWLVASREAARECRRKKKEYVKCLENRLAVLENQNKTLIEELRALKDIYRHKAEWSLCLEEEPGLCVWTVSVYFCEGCLEDSWGFAFADTRSQMHANIHSHKALLVLAVYKMMSMFLALNYPCATTSEIKKKKTRSLLQVGVIIREHKKGLMSLWTGRIPESAGGEGWNIWSASRLTTLLWRSEAEGRGCSTSNSNNNYKILIRYIIW